MISSGSSSGRVRPVLVALAVFVALSACRHGGAGPPKPRKLAVFPVQNLTGGRAPVRELTAALDEALSQRGVPLLPRDALDAALAEHRIRNTSGVNGETAPVLRRLGVDAVLVPVVEMYRAEGPPRLVLRARVVSTADRPTVLWATSWARAGDESPGLLGLGVVSRVADLERAALASIADSVRAFVERGDPGPSCEADSRFRPRRAFRSPLLDDLGRRSIAVLPFVNETRARDAGDAVMEQVVAELARSRQFDVLDPAFVRQGLLTTRMMLPEGISLDDARIVLESVGADLVVSGTVLVHDQPTTAAPPREELTVYALDRATGGLVWSSTSYGKGDDGVWLFDHRRVATTGALSCRIVKGVVDAMISDRAPHTESGQEVPATIAPAPAPYAVSAPDAR